MQQQNFQYIILEIDKDLAGINRDQFIHILNAENVFARSYFAPGCHQMEPYKSNPHYTGLDLPITEKLANRLLALPTGTAIGTVEIDMICQIIRLVTSQSKHIQNQLQMVSS